MRKYAITLLIVLTIPLFISFEVNASENQVLYMADSYGTLLNWSDEEVEEFKDIVEKVRAGSELTQNERDWIEEYLVARLNSLPTVSNTEYRGGEVTAEELLGENADQLDRATLGPIYDETNRLASLNFLVSSTKRSSEAHWDLGDNLYFKIGEFEISIPMGSRITYEWWDELWNIVAPGTRVPHVYTIDAEVLKMTLALKYNIPFHIAEEILEFPYARKVPPYIEMSADIDVYDETGKKVGTFNKIEEINANHIYQETGIWFMEHAIQDMLTRFQTIEIERPKIHINVYHVEAKEREEGSPVIFRTATGIPDYRDAGKNYEFVEIIDIKTIVLDDYSRITISRNSGPAAMELPQGYEFLGSAVPNLIDAVYGDNLVDNIPYGYYGLRRLNVREQAYLPASTGVRIIDALGDTDIFFYYERNVLPDFEVVSLDPGTVYSSPDQDHKGKATFRLKEDNYFWPHEADIYIKHNDEIIFELKNEVFDPGQVKTFEFTWTGLEDEDSTLCAEIWPSIPTISQPRPGEELEDADPKDNEICIEVLTGVLTLTVLKDPDLVAVGTTEPPPGIYKVPRGSRVYLKATPNPNWKFVRWKGDISTTNPNTSVFMDKSKVVIAEFARKQFKLVIEAKPPVGGTTNPAPGIYYIDAGVLVNINAYPFVNYEFIKWEGDATGTNPTTQVRMNRDKHVIAIFEMNTPPPTPEPKGLGNPIIVD